MTEKETRKHMTAQLLPIYHWINSFFFKSNQRHNATWSNKNSIYNVNQIKYPNIIWFDILFLYFCFELGACFRRCEQMYGMGKAQYRSLTGIRINWYINRHPTIFSKGYYRCRECIPIPNGVWEETWKWKSLSLPPYNYIVKWPILIGKPFA